ncbi:MAG: 50S ribosomal protein L32 [Deltaproteobacteria bacterium RIFCSPLOWO2_12_FULL_40_28]|nr:MAG: 50S ribosomal protein L32 [Deltaproteobacteria bacterium RIFCSPHIGHO2_02_FULL_40_28]OGQ19638.1 MAG: 50S ribosomal protein L32 [Deltaproteobacteria bacterium RIFCSPHIGHO2_12_FULL_40_32]OGQ40915.1 MAG: 50S ribosomal protein L32 [Deltaproteobacteria bacterium RIFCSPLOWO2_02_FULL_40_36]OGQ54030.1 MAG: 50S ribosomal protein L32 [Deltaproteobacteria bacterium RIFCSPLOWO2_12_FULL_40_28]
MSLPKKKVSKSKQRMRRSHLNQRVGSPSIAVCSRCGTPKLSHRVCESCGYYNGVEVVKKDEF